MKKQKQSTRAAILQVGHLIEEADATRDHLIFLNENDEISMVTAGKYDDDPFILLAERAKMLSNGTSIYEIARIRRGDSAVLFNFDKENWVWDYTKIDAVTDIGRAILSAVADRLFDEAKARLDKEPPKNEPKNEDDPWDKFTPESDGSIGENTTR
jgi:hypothetical protein